MKKRKYSFWIVLIQFIVLLYSFVSVLSKVASNNLVYGILSSPFLFTVFAMLVIMGVYAILWQKALSHIELSIAYANKGVGLIWSMIWSALIFEEEIKWNNIFGVFIVIIGIIIVNIKHEN